MHQSTENGDPAPGPKKPTQILAASAGPPGGVFSFFTTIIPAKNPNRDIGPAAAAAAAAAAPAPAAAAADAAAAAAALMSLLGFFAGIIP